MFDVHLTAGDVYREIDVYRAGGTGRAGETARAELGLTVCYDVRFPDLYRDARQGWRAVIAVPAAFTIDRRGALARAAARAGDRDGLLRHRRGAGRPPRGRPRDVWPLADHRSVGEGACRGGLEPGFITGDIDPAFAQSARQAIPALANQRAVHAAGAAAPRG